MCWGVHQVHKGSICVDGDQRVTFQGLRIVLCEKVICPETGHIRKPKQVKHIDIPKEAKSASLTLYPIIGKALPS